MGARQLSARTLRNSAANDAIPTRLLDHNCGHCVAAGDHARLGRLELRGRRAVPPRNSPALRHRCDTQMTQRAPTFQPSNPPNFLPLAKLATKKRIPGTQPARSRRGEGPPRFKCVTATLTAARGGPHVRLAAQTTNDSRSRCSAPSLRRSRFYAAGDAPAAQVRAWPTVRQRGDRY